MKLLALETSAKSVSAAVCVGPQLLASTYLCTGLTHSGTLLPLVEAMLKNAKLSVAELDGIAVAAGPGSFTGLRIGVAAAKGLAWALDKPTLGVSTLEAMALPLAHCQGQILCAMDARRQQIYQALFEVQNGTLTRLCPDRAISLDELALAMKNHQTEKIIVGDGALLCYHHLIEWQIPCTLAPAHLRMQSAVGVALAAQAAPWEAWSDAQSLHIHYLRLSQAERERNERLQKESQ